MIVPPNENGIRSSAWVPVKPARGTMMNGSTRLVKLRADAVKLGLVESP